MSKKKRLVWGVGDNDVNIATRSVVGGKEVMDPSYTAWKDMLRRCYSTKFQETYPTYRGCSVDERWHKFSKFRAWFLTQTWKGMVLDKDIIIPNNKVYSPETCAYIPESLNLLLTDSAAVRGRYPIGVDLTRSGKLRARCKVDGKEVYLGSYSTPEEASQVYREFKSKLVFKIADEYHDPQVAAGLRLHAALILKGEEDG